MKARIVRVGNSRGIRLPKLLLDAAVPRPLARRAERPPPDDQLRTVDRARLVRREGPLGGAEVVAALAKLGELFAP